MPKLPTLPGSPRRRRGGGATATRPSRAQTRAPADAGVSKWALAAGAAGLFLFIIGLKRGWPAGFGPRPDSGPGDGAETDSGAP